MSPPLRRPLWHNLPARIIMATIYITKDTEIDWGAQKDLKNFGRLLGWIPRIIQILGRINLSLDWPVFACLFLLSSPVQSCGSRHHNWRINILFDRPTPVFVFPSLSQHTIGYVHIRPRYTICERPFQHQMNMILCDILFSPLVYHHLILSCFLNIVSCRIHSSPWNVW